MKEEFRGIVIDTDEIITIRCIKGDFIAIKSDFLYDDIKIGDEVLFKPVYDILNKATLISKENE